MANPNQPDQNQPREASRGQQQQQGQGQPQGTQAQPPQQQQRTGLQRTRREMPVSGMIRTPFVRQQFGDDMYKLFEETKKIFDPENIFNPGKKTDITEEYLESHIRTSW